VRAAQEDPVPLSHSQLEAATVDLEERLRLLVERLARNEMSPIELRRQLADYWAINGSLIRAFSAAVGNELRDQAISRLYEWRVRLSEQLPTRST